MNLVEEIRDGFSRVERPDDKDYTTSVGGEAYEESSEFFGRRWETLSLDFLEKYAGVLFWFTPETFHYYLPAFLAAAVQADDISAGYIDSLLFLLRPESNLEFRRARWSLLDDEQTAVLRKWLDWVLVKAGDDHMLGSDVRAAMEAVDARLWW